MSLLITLAAYEPPAMPTEHTVHRVLTRLKKRLGVDDDGPALQQNGLERASLAALDAVTQPGGAILREALDVELQGWLKTRTPAHWLNLLVLPPCDDSGLVEAWASAAGHQLLAPPQRHELTALHDPELPELDGSGLLVIPRLEQWFIRQRNGLRLVRELLARLSALERHCLIGCNSWAWRFLVKAIGADALLPQPRTLTPTDASRLRDWFAEHAVDDQGRRITFRTTQSGQDVLATDDAGKLVNNHLQQLAARSLGIPWVAVQLWRASLNVRTGDDQVSDRARRAIADDERTVWVASSDDCSLPSGHEDRSLLALHALLIHGELTAQELAAVLPPTGEPDVMPALGAAGWVQREARLYRVSAGAYPALRQALQFAGMPLGRM